MEFLAPIPLSELVGRFVNLMMSCLWEGVPWTAKSNLQAVG